MKVLDSPSTSEPPDADVLIEEARQRQRKRRWFVAAAVLIVAVASGVWASSNGESVVKPPPPSSTSKKPGHTKSPTTPSTTPKSATALGASSLYPVAISFSDAEHGLLLLQGCSASLCTSSFDVTIDGGKNWKPRTAFLTYPATASTHVQGVDAVVF
jgi:hypothetical protein